MNWPLSNPANLQIVSELLRRKKQKLQTSNETNQRIPAPMLGNLFFHIISHLDNNAILCPSSVICSSSDFSFDWMQMKIISSSAVLQKLLTPSGAILMILPVRIGKQSSSTWKYPEPFKTKYVYSFLVCVWKNYIFPCMVRFSFSSNTCVTAR